MEVTEPNKRSTDSNSSEIVEKTKKRVTSRFFDRTNAANSGVERERIRVSTLELDQSFGPTKKRVTSRFFGPQPKDEEKTSKNSSIPADAIPTRKKKERRDRGNGGENADNSKRDSPLTQIHSEFSISPVCESEKNGCCQSDKGLKWKTKEERIVSPYFKHLDPKAAEVESDSCEFGRKRRNTSLDWEDEEQHSVKIKKTGKEAGDDGLLPKRTVPPNRNNSFYEMLAKFEYKGTNGLLSRNTNDDRKAGVEVVNQREPKEMKPLKQCQKASNKVQKCFPKASSDESGQEKKSRQKRKSARLTEAEKKCEAYRKKTPDNTWKPPRSKFGLLQEDHAFDPWRVLTICMLLNCTTGKQVKGVINEFFSKYPTAKTATEARGEEMGKLIRPLGLYKKRPAMIKRMSQEYLGDEWTHVTQLHGIGKYAADAHAIFCTGQWEQVKPEDHKLNDYWNFLHNVSK